MSAPQTETPPAITLNGKSYPIAELSPQAREQVRLIKTADEQAAHLRRMIAICLSARAGYALALEKALDDQIGKKPPQHPVQKHRSLVDGVPRRKSI